jgi:hypothetical protein
MGSNFFIEYQSRSVRAKACIFTMREKDDQEDAEAHLKAE